jgi:nitric-oxide synthase
VLPLQICDEYGQRHLFEYPTGVVQEAPMEHPTQPTFASLGLRWYTVPAVSSMVLSIGGIEYPCAPFNGFYMASEIASRNFADVSRYDQLRVVAEEFGALTLEEAGIGVSGGVEFHHRIGERGASVLDHVEQDARFFEELFVLHGCLPRLRVRARTWR